MANCLTNVNENWIYQGNRLIEASYSLTVLEQKLIRVLASMIKKDDDDFATYEFRAKELSQILNIHTKNIYKELDSITDKLMTRFIKIKDDDTEKFKKRHVIEVAHFENGTLKLKIHKDMKDFYLKLNWYTKYQLKNVMQFKSTYSFRVYELLKQYQNIGHRIISIEDLRVMLDIGKTEYPKYANLKQKVISVTIKEINEKTDLNIEFEEIKASRKVEGIKFKIKPKANNVASKEVAAATINIDEEIGANLEPDIIELVEYMRKHKFLPMQVAQLYELTNKDKELLKEVYDYCKTRAKENLYGYIQNTLKAGYVPPIKSKGIDDFNNYEQRQYDFDKLERKLLGWDD